MSSIAIKVGGSKSTLWTYFPSKCALFEAVIEDVIKEHGELLLIELSIDRDVFEVLAEFGRVLMETLNSPLMLSLNRLVRGEAQRFPHLAKMFYDLGPQRAKDRLMSYVKAMMENGALRSGDPSVLVQQFIGLCQSGVYHKALLGLANEISLATVSNDIDIAICVLRQLWELSKSDNDAVAAISRLRN